MLLLAACGAAQPPADQSAESPPVGVEQNGTDSSQDDADSSKDDADPSQDDTDSSKDDTDSSQDDADSSKDDADPSQDDADSSKDDTDSSKDDTDPSQDDTDSSQDDTDPSQDDNNSDTDTPDNPNEETAPAEYTLKISETTLTCKEYGKGKKVTYTYTGTNAASLVWSSGNTKVAAVDQKGNVTPLEAGTSWITLTDGVKTAQCQVTVTQVTLKLSATEISLQVGNTAKLTVSYDGENPLTWDYNSKYVSVSNGVVSAKAEGTVYITVADGFKQAQCKVIITASGGGTTKPTPKTLKINTKDYTEIVVGSTLQIDYTYDGDKSDLTWESDNTKYFTVNSNGLVTAKSVGGTGVFVTDGNLSAYVLLKVVEPVTYPATTKLEVVSSNAPISNGITKYAGDSMRFDVRAYPDNCNLDTTAKSSDSSVVSVSYQKNPNSGLTRVTLNFKKAGNATITVTSADGAKSLSYSITVKGDYACNPGSGILTPEQFVNAYNGVVKANGMSTSGMPTGYLVLTLGEGGLTWSKARSAAEGRFHEWWAIGYRTIVLTYEGRDDNGNHVFHVRGY